MATEPALPRPPSPEAVAGWLGEPVRESIDIEGRTYVIERPAQAEQLLDHPAVRAALCQDDYLPYWAELWPAARMLGKAILQEPWQPGLTALELGCGLGLPGIVALSAGLKVIFSDYDLTALGFAAGNARLNGYTDYTIWQLDWRQPPENVQVPVILGSDLVYEERHVEPLVHLLTKLLAPEGLCLLTCGDRIPVQALSDALPAKGLQSSSRTVRCMGPGNERHRGTLYRISWHTR
jgi:predicted nicotinamide N-methyase